MSLQYEPVRGMPGNAAGATPTVKWGIQMTNGTATIGCPEPDGTVLYVLENRAAGVVLHAINVNNITTNPGTYNFGTLVWSNAHVLSTSPIGTRRANSSSRSRFAGIVDNVASPYLDYSGQPDFLRRFRGTDSARHQHRSRDPASRDVTNFTNACGAAQLQSPVF